MDSYRNLTLKSLFLLKYATEFCGDVPFLVKSDDDMLINVPYLARVLQTQKVKRSIIGYICPNSAVHREGKWEVSRAEYPLERYPKYASGSAYVIQIPLASELLEASKYVRWFSMEDVYVTGILAKEVKANHVTMNNKFDMFSRRVPNYCDVIRETKMFTWLAAPEVLTEIWEKLKKKSDQDLGNCKTQNFRRNSEKIKIS